MDGSSPLAAMRPPLLPFGQSNWNTYSLDSRLASFSPSDNFNFKDISMNSGSYFNPRPSRGASPTASLAVDMSRNFHLDKSPVLPTPRKTLFQTKVEVITPPFITNGNTPVDSMDISPLPHKQPYVLLQSATPMDTPSESNESMLSSPAFVPESPLVTLRSQPGNERRRPTISRPTLSRMKGLSTSSVTTVKSAGLDAPPPFKFGSSSTTTSKSAGLDNPPAFRFGNMSFLSRDKQASLEDSFVESPQSMTFSSSLDSSPMESTRPRSAQQTFNPFDQHRASPMPFVPMKKPAPPMARPRKQFRRSLSMYEHPADVFTQQQQEREAETGGASTVMDVDEVSQPLQLPHFMPDDDSLPRITKETMIDILDGKFKSLYDNSMVIDCRFEYEYKGGHIDGAINFNDKEELASKLFDQPMSSRTLLVFHCEYSAHRAPIAAKYIRGEDRATNAHQYPRLTYPEVYILDGGYSSFFKDHKSRCYPQQYVEMNDKQHVTACERGLGKMKQHRVKLGRSATYAFGQHNQMQDSPTGQGKTSTMGMMIDMDISMDDSPIMKRATNRRMCSF